MSYLKKPKVIRKKSGDQQYDLLVGTVVVGTGIKTGSHLDHYPWEWSLSDELATQLKGVKDTNGMPARTQRSVETLRDCVDAVATTIAHYGLRFD